MKCLHQEPIRDDDELICVHPARKFTVCTYAGIEEQCYLFESPIKTGRVPEDESD